jgi:hypothetical protein
MWESFAAAFVEVFDPADFQLRLEAKVADCPRSPD